MNLEDHIGDLVHKGRLMSNVSTSSAASAAGLTEAELAELENSGTVAKQPDWIALGELIGLDGRKLARIAAGWLPKVPDLSQWRELRMITTSSGGMAVNCYLVWDEVTREAALFDTGWEADPVVSLLEQNQLQLQHVFITHGHQDHVAALPEVRRRFPKARLHSGSMSAPVAQRNRPNDFIHLGNLRIMHRETPGHAEDGTTYVVGTWPEDAPHVAIVGDAIFAGSIGRGNQSWVTARAAVRKEIFTLPGPTLVCPGHGPLTTVAEEKEFNPFF